MKAYEIMYILPTAEVSDATLKKNAADLKEEIAKLGEITYEEEWGRRDMTYSIEKNDVGFYFYLHASLDGDKLDELKKQYNIDERILRYMVTALPAGYQSKDDQHLVEIVNDLANFGEERAKATSSQPIPNPDKSGGKIKGEKASEEKKEGTDKKIDKILSE